MALRSPTRQAHDPETRYPLVNIQIAIENGPSIVEISHWTLVIFHSFLYVYQREMKLVMLCYVSLAFPIENWWFPFTVLISPMKNANVEIPWLAMLDFASHWHRLMLPQHSPKKMHRILSEFFKLNATATDLSWFVSHCCLQITLFRPNPARAARILRSSPVSLALVKFFGPAKVNGLSQTCWGTRLWRRSWPLITDPH